MSRLNEIRTRLKAATEEPFYKRVAIWGSGPTRYMLQPYLLEEDIAFILDSREDMALLMDVVEAVIGLKGSGDLHKAINEIRFEANYNRRLPLYGQRFRTLQESLEGLT